jgi:hypothetical protein
MIDLKASEWLGSLPNDTLAQGVNPALSADGAEALLGSGSRQAFLDLANQRLIGISDDDDGDELPPMARFLIENPQQLGELVKLIGGLANGQGVRRMVGRDDINTVKEFLGEAYQRAAIRNADEYYCDKCPPMSGKDLVKRIGQRGEELMGSWIGKQPDPVKATLLRVLGPEYSGLKKGYDRADQPWDHGEGNIYDAAFAEFEKNLRGGA